MRGKKALVIGLGVSGSSAARFLIKNGVSVTAVDRNAAHLQLNPEIRELQQLGLSLLSEDAPLNVNTFDVAVISPGIPTDHPLYLQLLRQGIETIGEIELACRSIDRPFIGITGSNGKTTVCMMVAHVLNHAGKPAKILGNFGIPLTSAIDKGDEIIVCELSSFQLETLQASVMDAALILNITPNHLDRHRSMLDYAAAKARIGGCLKPEGKLYLGSQVTHHFSHLFEKYKKNIEMIAPPHYKGISSHDVENQAAAFALCRQFGVSEIVFEEALKSFKKPPHRIEFVQSLNGVRYYNDSKATNLEAVVKAVESMPGPIVLIAGGKDKGSSYTYWLNSFKGRVKGIVAIGEAQDKLEHELSGQIFVHKENTLESAVRRASAIAEEGDCVLLSPGCSSYDMFKNYEDRGDKYKEIVRRINGD